MDADVAVPSGESTPPPAAARPTRAQRSAKPAAQPPASSPSPDVRLSPLQAAYQQAKEQHSQLESESAPAADARTAPETDTTPSQSKAPEPDATSSAQEPTFLPDEEASALQAEFADNPDGYRKELDKRFNKALTQSTQKLSKLRKDLEPFADILDGLDTDPQTTIRALAQKHGVTLGDQPAAAKASPEATTDTLTTLKDGVPSEFHWMVDMLGPAIGKLLDQKVKQSIDPVTSRLHEHDQRTAAEEVSREMKAFEAKYPKWREHEDAMTALGAKFPPSGNVTESEWMESLYKLATYESAIAAQTQQAIQRMTTAAKQSETSRPAVDGSRVQAVMPPNAGFREAVAAAKRGERW